MDDASLQEMFTDAVRRLQAEPQRMADLTATYQFHITGDGGGGWHMEILDGRARLGNGEAAAPDVTVTIKDTDFMALRTGQLSGQRAFMTGKIRVRGNLRLAMRLGSIFA